ncbi:hypothetical protein [Rhodococcus opacus]|uniref:hypothetical protein n=1 Tax=Rhodococcus opacus TaxID=37919 RepID=UPI001F57FE4A|nr:hypothetical protein [Rhodococcus opacus]UNN05286.1 hypothetical protein MOO23_40930 [Rhodococcus opacus]
MEQNIARRDVLEGIRAQLKEMGFADVSTRRGNTAGGFHIDGNSVIGRGTVAREPVDADTLKEIHAAVFTLERMRGKRWIHLSYGGYTAAARSFATAVGIALFQCDSSSNLTPIGSRARALKRQTPAGKRRTKIIGRAAGILAAVILLILAMSFPSASVPILIAVGVVIVLIVASFIIDFLLPFFRRL